MLSKFRLKLSPSTLVVIAAFLWSLDAVVRANLRTIPPAFLVTIEHLFGLIFLLPWLWTMRKQVLEAKRSTKIALIVTSILSGALGTIFYTAALAQVQYVPFSVVVLMQQLQPVFVVIMSWLILKEKVSREFIIDGIFALIGAYLLSFPNLTPDIKTQLGIQQTLAAVLALGAAFAWGSGTIFSKFTLKEIDYRAATAWRFLITIPVAFILSIVLNQLYPLNQIGLDKIVQIFVIVLSAGTVAMLIYYKGLAHTEAKVSTFLELVFPLSVFAFDLIRGVRFTNSQLIGAVLLVAMLWKISRRNSEK